MQKYISHKEVEAFEIGRIESHTIFAKDESESVVVSADYIIKHPLNLPGYYVRYSNGYESWSPKEEFEKGYSRKRRILHVSVDSELIKKAGTNVSATLEQIMDLFKNAVTDTEGGVVSTIGGIESDIVEIDIDTIGTVDTPVGTAEYVTISVREKEEAENA